MRPRRLALAIASILAAATLAPLGPASPAGAEVDDNSTISWGVTGLETGTQTDTIRSNVFAIEQIGDRVYVGGRFLAATNGATTADQPFLAAFNATTGEFDPSFRPDLDGPVYALDRSPDGSTLYVGGEFTHVGGQYRRAITSLDPTTGTLNSGWPARVVGGALVRGLDVRDGYLYVGGRFDAVRSTSPLQSATNVVRFRLSDGSHDRDWTPSVQGGTVWSVTASPSADRVYIVGYFDQVNGANRSGGFAALNASNDDNAAGVETFKYNAINPARRYAYDVEVAGGNVFVGGSEHYVAVMRESDLKLMKFHYSDPRGDYQDLEVVGDRVYAGCHCGRGADFWTSNDRIWFRFNAPAGETNGPILYQSTTTWIVAFDAASGDRIPSFYPAITSLNAGVWGIHGAPDGCLWIAGQITTDGSGSVDNMVRLCETTTDSERPSPPKGLAVDRQIDDTATLSWRASTDNVGVAGYNVYDFADGSLVDTAVGLSITLSGLTEGDHTYYVKAFDQAGNVSWRSNTRTVTVAATRPNPNGCTIWGTEGDDVILGTDGDDVICALGGDDYIRSWGGEDTIYAGPGNDDVDGGDGNDRIFGGEGDDVVRGGADDDFVDGNQGNDRVGGWNGIDYLVGGEGDDVLLGGDGDDTILGHGGSDTIWSGAGNDDVDGGDGNDYVYGEAGDDIVRGGGHDDHVYGGDGNDIVNGWLGDDYLEGGPGTDSLNGGEGTDQCVGGETLVSCE